MIDPQKNTSEPEHPENPVKDSLAKRLLGIGQKCAPLFKEPHRSTDHGDLLYDDKGLPK